MVRLKRAAILLAALAAAASARAQDAQPARTPQELEALEAQIAAETQAAETQAAERARLAAERDRLSAEAIAAATAIRAAERELARLEAAILDLGGRDVELTAALAERRSSIQPLLAALQRLRRDPPPALAVSPGDAARAARATMMLAGLTRALEREARSLAADLAAIAGVRADLSVRRAEAASEAERLASRRAELDATIAERAVALAALDDGLSAAQARLEGLEARASDMRGLMAWVGESDGAAPAAQAAEAPVTVGARRQASGLRARKGKLPWPAEGRVAIAFGDPRGEGGATEGATLATRAGAVVTAPADGEIVFSGPFRGYGDLLILSAGDGYFVLIGGLGRLDAVAGQFVLTGEPVGVAGGAEDGGGRVYVELRKDDAPQDPGDWFERPGPQS